MAKCYWFTGLPCSGKTTLAKEMLKRIDAEWFDGDEVRNTPLTTEGFSSWERERHLLRLAYISKILVNRNINVIVSCITPIESVRCKIRGILGDKLKEIYLSASKEVCEKRDVKGMWKIARNGLIKDFTGVSSGYDVPLSPDLILDTEKLSIEVCVNKILKQDKKDIVVFVGRFQPFHQGHKQIIQNELDEGKKVCVVVKFTKTDKDNPYVPKEIKEMIRDEFGDKVEVWDLPNFTDFIYGRKVGYNIRQVRLSEDLEKISATKIREGNRDESNSKHEA